MVENRKQKKLKSKIELLEVLGHKAYDSRENVGFSGLFIALRMIAYGHLPNWFIIYL